MLGLVLLAMAFTISFADISDHCGTFSFFNNVKIAEEKGIKLLAKDGCAPDNYYGTVYSRKTEHFIIYYTVAESNRAVNVHAVPTTAYVDSLALYLENAYKLHFDSLGMQQGILGVSRTYHYQQNVPAGLYPIEVVDTGLLRNVESDYSNTFGLTFAVNSRSPFATQIVIENDFLHGSTCSKPKSTLPFCFISNGKCLIDYSKEWRLALKITAYHELYHSFQLRKIDLNENKTFWLESAAAAVEEIGAPEVNDYWAYLPVVFNKPGLSMEDSYNRGDGSAYGYSTLYLYLFSELGRQFGSQGTKFDSQIINYFVKYPKDNFSAQLARLAASLGLDAEDLFHEYATAVFFSGTRAEFSPTPFFAEDQPNWGNWRVHTEENASSVLPAGAIDFVRSSGSAPNVDSVLRMSLLSAGDASVWVLSRLLGKEIVNAPEKFIAFPNPWNPITVPELKFGVLPPNSTGIEIRSANGNLLDRVRGAGGSSLIWNPKKTPAPGILYYRNLPHGKNKVLIVEY